MSRFHFHVSDGRDYPDLQGKELETLGDARREAVRCSGALLARAGDSFWEGEEWTMRVTDGDDLTLFTLMFIATDAAAVDRKRIAPLVKPPPS
jgi:hypothetical protein